MHTAQEQEESRKRFIEDPIETMRSSIFRIFLAEMLLRGNGDVSSIEFKEINIADEDKVDGEQSIRTNFALKDAKVEIQWTYEYGDWRIDKVNMKRFTDLLNGKQNPSALQGKSDQRLSLLNGAPLPIAAIKIDGSFDDWQNIPSIVVGPQAATDNMSVSKVSMAMDSQDLFIKYDITDTSPSSPSRPHNFDESLNPRNPTYGVDMDSGDSQNGVTVTLTYWGSPSQHSKWYYSTLVVEKGSYREVDTLRGRYIMKGSSVEIAVPIALVKRYLGAPGKKRLIAWTRVGNDSPHKTEAGWFSFAESK
jgi:hypothetical protein